MSDSAAARIDAAEVVARALDRPDLVDQPGDLPATQRAAMRLIEARAIELRVFDRGGQLVRLVALPGEPVRFHPLSHHSITGLVHDVCRPVRVKENAKTGEKEITPVTFSERGAKAMADSSEWRLPRLDGVAVAPLLAEDGAIRTANGYDTVTRLWCADIPDIRVKARPTRQDAEAALRSIRKTWATFPFKDAHRISDSGLDLVDIDQPPGEAESALLHAVLTAIAKPSLPLTPGFLVNAPNTSGAGSGKGLLMNSVCAVAHGGPPVAITAGHNADELEKRLTSGLMEAGSALFLDNANGLDLTSSTLENIITEKAPQRARILGGSGMAVLNSTAFIAVAGNGLTVSEDMARRILICELDAKMEDPESREFPDGRDGFLKSVKARRGELLAAALTIWRWGRQAEGKLTKGKPFGSFETWARWVRDPLLALGCYDPVLAIAAAKARDPKRRQIAELFETWWAAHDNLPMLAKDLSDEVRAILDPHNRARQTIVSSLNKKIGSRSAGFVLTRQDAPGAWGKATYRLCKTDAPAAAPPAPAQPIEGGGQWI